MNFGKYLQGVFSGEAYTIKNPATTLVSSITRSWTDPNGDKVAQCDFLNPVANQECGPWSNLNWGASVATTRVNPAVLEGWGVRNNDWQFGIGIQHQILPRMSIDVSYNRRSWNNFFTTHNAALTAGGLGSGDAHGAAEPAAAGRRRLPGDVPRAQRRARRSACRDPYYTTDADFGDETHYWHGVDVSFSARLRGSLFLQAGTSTGRGVNDTCADRRSRRFGKPMVHRRRPADVRFTEPWLTQARGLVSYTVPKVDVLVSAIFRSQPNAQPAATTVAHQRRFANRELPDDAGAVPGGHRRAAAGRTGAAGASTCWRQAPSTAIASTSWTCGWPRCCASATSG